MNNQKEREKRMDERVQQTEERIRKSEEREEKLQHIFRHVLHVLEKIIAIITLVVMLAALAELLVELVLHPGPLRNVSGFLHEVLTIVVGLEFVRMLIDTTPASILEVLTVAITRALILDPSIMIFDEATSALDYESESIIMKNLDQIAKGRTMLMIAHRLSTVRDCDAIIMLDHGRIVEAGSHEELLQRQGAYYRLYMAQVG